MEHFKTFIELQSLLKKIATHEDQVRSSESRIEFIEASRAKRVELRDQLCTKRDQVNKDLNDQEKLLFNKERDLKRATDNLTQASSESQMKALETEIERVTEEIDVIQEGILEKLEEEESITANITESDEFLLGSLETLNEVKAEVKIEVDKELKEINNYKSRIGLLSDSLEKAHRDFFNQTLENVKDNQVISFLTGKICTRCKYEASSTQITEIENGRSIEVCDSCSRILIPATINNF